MVVHDGWKSHLNCYNCFRSLKESEAEEDRQARRERHDRTREAATRLYSRREIQLRAKAGSAAHHDADEIEVPVEEAIHLLYHTDFCAHERIFGIYVAGLLLACV
jgi:hypothetical protein